MTTSMVMDMNLGENGGGKQSVNGGVGGRRRSKGNELTQKKKQPQRGMGVAQLERLRLQERWKKMTEVPPLHALPLPSFNSSSAAFASSCITVPNGAIQFRPATAPSMFQGTGNGCGMFHGPNLFSSDHVTDPSVIGSCNVGFRVENSKELSSIPNYVKCASDGCGVCHKKKRINGGSKAEICLVNPFGNFWGDNTVAETIDAGKTRRSSGQGSEAMAVHRNGRGAAIGSGSVLTEYEFFPGKGGGAENVLRMGTGSTSTWCGSSVGVIGLRGGTEQRSCVTATTGSDEGGVSSIDLSLKLSY